MRRWAPVLAVIGLAHGASAGELNPDMLRGPVVPNERVAQARAQDTYRAGSKGYEPNYNVFDWTGFYIGGHIGAGTGTAKFADPFGSSIYGDKVTTPGFLFGGQIGYNWQVPNSPWVFGLEGDLDWLDSDGTNTCLAYSGFYVSANCHARPNMMGDLTARVGWAYGQFNHSLVYAKGGAAFIHDKTDITTNSTLLSTGSSFTKSGWTIGAGVEHAIALAWSVNLEYDYFDFGKATVATPPGLFQPFPPVPLYGLTPAASTSVTQNFQEVKLGLNYRFGMDPTAQWGSASSAFPAAPGMAPAPEWEIELGARYWYSSGRFQKDLGATTDPALANTLGSRLTYKSIANSGEFFGRVEALNVFVKGNIGAGSLSSGHMNDEDWALSGYTFPAWVTAPYSNTLAEPVKGDIDYATVDLGYDFFRSAGYKLGAFIGYNYYKENKSAYGCIQIANPFSDCVPASLIPPSPSSVLGITQDSTWESFRVGVNGEVMIADRLKLGADVAYLPYVAYTGTDNHVLRALISPESATGRGAQLEAVLSWLITDQFSVGVGWRYWAMWSTDNAIVNFNGAPCPCLTLPVKTERDGVFLQATYKFSGTN